MDIEIKIISLKNPCSACYIKYNYIKQIIESIKNKYPYVVFLDLIYETENEAAEAEDLKLKIFPTIKVNNFQYSAGIIPNKKELEKYLESLIKSF